MRVQSFTCLHIVLFPYVNWTKCYASLRFLMGAITHSAPTQMNTQYYFMYPRLIFFLSMIHQLALNGYVDLPMR